MKMMSNQLLKTVAFQTVVNNEIEKETQNAQETPENVTGDVVSLNTEEVSGDASVPEEESAEGGTTGDVTDGEAAADMTETEEGAVDVQEAETAEGMDVSGEMMAEDGMGDMMGTETGIQANGSVLASYPFVIGISAVTLALSIVIGILLGKRKIKKGLDLYED